MLFKDNLKSGVISMMIYLAVSIIGYIFPSSGMSIVAYGFLFSGVYRLMIISGENRELQVSWRLLFLHLIVIVINLFFTIWVLNQFEGGGLGSELVMSNFWLRLLGAFGNVTIFLSYYFLSEGSRVICLEQFRNDGVASLFRLTAITFIALIALEVCCLMFPLLQFSKFVVTIVVQVVMALTYLLMYKGLQ